jgi:hypothetical protein
VAVLERAHRRQVVGLCTHSNAQQKLEGKLTETVCQKAVLATCDRRNKCVPVRSSHTTSTRLCPISHPALAWTYQNRKKTPSCFMCVRTCEMPACSRSR